VQHKKTQKEKFEELEAELEKRKQIWKQTGACECGCDHIHFRKMIIPLGAKWKATCKSCKKYWDIPINITEPEGYGSLS
jgi:hypothetical protein